MTTSASTGPRRRAPSWWCWWQDHGELITVAELLGQNQRLLFHYRLRQYQREHSGPARRITVVPRTAADQRVRC